MIESEEKWDFEFYTDFIPNYLLELQKNEVWLERFIFALSEFSHRCNQLLIQLPIRFKIGKMGEFHSKIKEMAAHIADERKQDYKNFTKLYKEMKIARFELSQTFEKAREKARVLQAKIQENEEQIKANESERNLLPSVKNNCPFVAEEKRNLNVNHILDEKKKAEIFQKNQEIAEQLEALKKKRKSFWSSKNCQFRAGIDKITEVTELLELVGRNKKFETFRRQSKSSSQKNNQSYVISDFKNEEANQIINLAAKKCETKIYKSSEKLNPFNVKNVLSRAILAQSTEEAEQNSNASIIGIRRTFEISTQSQTK